VTPVRDAITRIINDARHRYKYKTDYSPEHSPEQSLLYCSDLYRSRNLWYKSTSSLLPSTRMGYVKQTKSLF